MLKTKTKVAVLGAGNMGTALAQIIASNGFEVDLWNYAGEQESLNQINKYRENKKYLPKIKLSQKIKPQPDLKQALDKAKVVFFAVPSNCIKSVVKPASKFLEPQAICVDVSKGIDQESLGIIPDVIKKNLPKKLAPLVATVSGPAIANEMVKGGFTAMNVGSKSKISIIKIKQVLENDNLRLYATDDIIGIELVGSFKNVYAIAMGLCDGLKMPMNTKAALLVVALKEISILVKKMGGKPETVYDLAGLGDLIGTGLCTASRNRRFGEYLAKNNDIDNSLQKVGQVVEGISAAKILYVLGKKYKIKTPFAEMVYKVSSGKASPNQALTNFLQKI